MNILHVVNVYFTLPYFLGDQLTYFKNLGCNLSVVCSPSEYLQEFVQKQGCGCLATPVNRSISIKEDLKSISRIIRFIRKHKIDIIVGHTPKGGLLAMIAGKIAGVKKRIYFRHGLVYETSTGLKRQILINVDRIASLCATQIVCVSPWLAEQSIKDNLCPAKKQIVLNKGTCNGVDAHYHFNPDNISSEKVDELRLKYGIDKENFVVGYAGRIVRDKGIKELIEAFDKLENADNCRLLLVGMFEDRDALPEDVKARILNDPRIIYTGFVNGGMEYYYSLMDVFVLPSYREGFSTGNIEAQAMELPVITTQHTGCRDSILKDVTGLYTKIDPADIAKKIDDIRLRHAIDGREGRKWVVENFDSRIIWKELEKLYLL